jgi:hypothetical protein
VDQAVNDVKAKLEGDQKALQDFLANNPINEITQELSQTVAFIQSATASGASTDLTLFDAEKQSIRDQIASSYTTTVALDQQLNEIEALRLRIEQSADDQSSLSANQVALMVLLNKVVAGNSGSQVQLQLNIADLGKGPLTKSNQIHDVDSTAAAVRKLRDDIKGQISQLEARLSAPAVQSTPGVNTASDALVQSYLQRQSELESELERRTFELDQLQKARDLDQMTYDLLRNRAAEQQVNQMVSGIVDIGQRADSLQTTRSHSSLRSLAINVVQWCMIALVFGVLLSYLFSLLLPGFSFNGSVGRALRKSRAKTSAEAERTARVGSGG